MAETQSLVLVVEDDDSIRRFLTAALQDEGFAVVAAGSASGARDRLADRKPDLIVLDVKMPDVDGLTLLREMREDPRYAGIPVLVVTAGRTGEAEAQGNGANGFLAKPFDLGDLLDRVHRLLAA